MRSGDRRCARTPRARLRVRRRQRLDERASADRAAPVACARSVQTRMTGPSGRAPRPDVRTCGEGREVEVQQVSRVLELATLQSPAGAGWPPGPLRLLGWLSGCRPGRRTSSRVTPRRLRAGVELGSERAIEVDWSTAPCAPTDPAARAAGTPPRSVPSPSAAHRTLRTASSTGRPGSRLERPTPSTGPATAATACARGVPDPSRRLVEGGEVDRAARWPRHARAGVGPTQASSRTSSPRRNRWQRTPPVARPLAG